MVSVCVLGAGPAGVEAATEAAMNGARVKLLDASDGPRLPRCEWPRLIEDPKLISSTIRLPTNLDGVEVVWGSHAKALLPGCRVLTRGESSRFDKIVVATGTQAKVKTLPGLKKPGVHMLDSHFGYLNLGQAVGSTGHAVIWGGGVATLIIADKLLGAGRRLTLVRSRESGDGSFLSTSISEVILQRVAGSGILIIDGQLERSVGIDSIEAVVVSGSVISCDALVVVPEFMPSSPVGARATGPLGGIIVGSMLESEYVGCFAAGGCAELAMPGGSQTALLGSSGAASGRVAGANASGRSLTFKHMGAFDFSFFGLRLAGAGFPISKARASGFDAVESFTKEGDDYAVSIVFAKGSGRILGIQSIGRSSGLNSSVLAQVVSQPLTLKSLLYSDLGRSTDISLIAETARQGISLERMNP